MDCEILCQKRFFSGYQLLDLSGKMPSRTTSQSGDDSYPQPTRSGVIVPWIACCWTMRPRCFRQTPTLVGPIGRTPRIATFDFSDTCACSWYSENLCCFSSHGNFAVIWLCVASGLFTKSSYRILRKRSWPNNERAQACNSRQSLMFE